MSSPPWMPLYIGDFVADTMHLSAAETGIYVRLLLHCWQHTVIPRDDRKLAMIAHCDYRHWHNYKDAVLAFFQPLDGNQLYSVRVDKELRRALEISNKRKEAALQKHSKRSANALPLIKKESKSLTRTSSQSDPAPQQGATEEASKGHPLQATPELVLIVQRDVRRGYG